MYVLKTGISWRDLICPMNWNSVYKVYVKLNSFNIFKISYVSLLNKYYKKTYNNKLKYISTDTSFIPNKKGKDMIGYNKYYNKKNGTKISLITDSKGIHFNVEFYKGNDHDSKILIKQLKTTNLVQLNEKIPDNAYFMGDPGYDGNQIRTKLKEMNYVPLIVQNRRNIKDKTKIVTLNNKEKEISYRKNV
jgi:hypothetical protein